MRKERRDLPLADILPNTGQVDWLPSNPRQWTAQDINRTARSIKEDTDFLEERPILVFPLDGKFIAFAGNLRREGCIKNKMATAPCVIHYPENEADQETIKRRAIKDNGQFGSWDFDALANEWDGPLADWGVPVWDAEQTQDDADAPEAQEDDFDETAEAVETRCSPGDIWQLGNHRLMCGDSTDAAQVALLMNGERADLLMTEPPYGISADKMTMGTGKQNYTRGDWDNTRPDILPMLKYAPLACIWGGNYFADVLPANNDWLCWHKKNDGLSFSEFELAWTNYGRNCRHISHHWGSEKKQHITMKPVPVIAWAIQQAKSDVHTILDLFGGSGTTLIAAEQIGEDCRIMEIDPHFCDVILARWEKLTGQTATKL